VSGRSRVEALKRLSTLHEMESIAYSS